MQRLRRLSSINPTWSASSLNGGGAGAPTGGTIHISMADVRTSAAVLLLTHTNTLPGPASRRDAAFLRDRGARNT